MAHQLDRLVSWSELPSVRIGVLPLDRLVPDGAYHTFVVYDRRLATIELFTGQLVLRDPKDTGPTTPGAVAVALERVPVSRTSRGRVRSTSTPTSPAC